MQKLQRGGEKVETHMQLVSGWTSGNILAKGICLKVQGLLQVLGECAAQNFAGKLQKALRVDQDHKDVL